MNIELNVNGHKHRVSVEPYRVLIDVLRNELELTGVKKGCGRGECGSCVVLMDSKPVHSCLVLAPQAEGKKIVTIEGLSEAGELHPLQEAFIRLGAIQCGFCTPGMILSAKALLDENLNPTEHEIRRAFSSNICRCTGYVKPVQAVMEAARMIREGKKGG